MQEMNTFVAAIQAAFSASVQDAVNTQVTARLVQHANIVSDLALRVQALETKLTEAALFTRTTDVEIQLDKARVIEALDSQEWFWEKLQSFVEKASGRAEVDLDDLAERVDLAKLARYINPSDLIANVDFSEVLDYSEIADQVDLSDLSNEMNLDDLASQVAGELDLSDLAGELNLSDLAGELDLKDLAGELDQDQIAGMIDVPGAIRDYFQNNVFSIRS